MLHHKQEQTSVWGLKLGGLNYNIMWGLFWLFDLSQMFLTQIYCHFRSQTEKLEGEKKNATHWSIIFGNLKGEEEGFPVNPFRFTGSSKISWWEQQCAKASSRNGRAQKQCGKAHVPVMVKEMMPGKYRSFFPLLLFSSTLRCSKKIQRIQSAGAAGRHRSSHSTPARHFSSCGRVSSWTSF